MLEAQAALTSWKKLLQITGGDLALEKCVYSFMGWKNEKGKEVLGSIRDHPGTITIGPTEGEAPTVIRRIEAWDAERILGVRCGLDGEDTTELKYRIEQAVALAGRIKQSPLTRFDAVIVYRERWMSTIKYCLPITRFTQQQCHQITKVVEQAILPKLGFNRHMPKVVLYGPRLYGGKQIMNTHTEQIILHLETFMAHIRGEDDIGTLQRILLNKQQLVAGAEEYILQTSYAKYQYCEHNEVTFLWDQLSKLNIQVDVQGAWKPTKRHKNDVFIMEGFIAKGYPTPILAVLNDIRVYMKIVVLSDILTCQGRKMSQWALKGEVNRYHTWVWPPRRVPTGQNLKVWRDCLRGTFMKGIDDVIYPLLGDVTEPSSILAHPKFNYAAMTRQGSLTATISQYPSELLSLLGHCPITDKEGQHIMEQLGLHKVSAASDGSVKDGIGGHSFCLSTNNFSHQIWGHAQTVGHTKDMSSLRAEHGGGTGSTPYTICDAYILSNSPITTRTYNLY